MSTSRWMDKGDVIYINNGTLLSHRKAWNSVPCNNMAATREYHAEWSRSERERQTLHDTTYVCVSLSHVQLLVTPWTIACQALPSKEFSRQEYWSWQPFHSPGGLPEPGTEPGPPALQADSLPSESPGKPQYHLPVESKIGHKLPDLETETESWT